MEVIRCFARAGTDLQTTRALQAGWNEVHFVRRGRKDRFATAYSAILVKQQ